MCLRYQIHMWEPVLKSLKIQGRYLCQSGILTHICQFSTFVTHYYRFYNVQGVETPKTQVANGIYDNLWQEIQFVILCELARVFCDTEFSMLSMYWIIYELDSQVQKHIFKFCYMCKTHWFPYIFTCFRKTWTKIFFICGIGLNKHRYSKWIEVSFFSVLHDSVIVRVWWQLMLIWHSNNATFQREKGKWYFCC